jgi:hypothetical protein
MQLAKVEPGSLVLVAPTDADAEQYFAIAVHRAGEPVTAAPCEPYAPIFRPRSRPSASC